MPGASEGPPHRGSVELPTKPFDKSVEAVVVEQLVELAVEGVRRGLGHVDRSHPKIFLPLSSPSSSHRHKTIVP